MKKNSIELEIRGEVRPREIHVLTKRLLSMGFKPLSTTRRTSVMSFGTVSGRGLEYARMTPNDVDVRCRITNGIAEVVTKVGLTSAANRTEVSVPVSLRDMLRFTQLFGAMPFFTKVGSKITTNLTRGQIVISFVKSPSGLAYIEIEKMTEPTKERKDLSALNEIANALNITLWKTHAQFIAFCDRLTNEDDWVFHGTKEDMKRLRQEIQKTRSDKRR